LTAAAARGGKELVADLEHAYEIGNLLREFTAVVNESKSRATIRLLRDGVEGQVIGDPDSSGVSASR